MKLIKKLFCAAFASLLIFTQLHAATVVFNIANGTAWNSTNFFAYPATINSVTINNSLGGATATNLTYALIDSPVTATGVNPTAPTNNWGPLWFTNTGYMAVSQVVTNLTRTVTNFAGLGQTTFPAGSTITNIYVISNVVQSVTNWTGTTTNFWRRLAVGTVASNTAVTVTGPFTVDFGLAITNNTVASPNGAISVTVDFNPNL